MGFGVATENMFRRRMVVSPGWVVNERQRISAPSELIRCGQAGERGAENNDGLCACGGHENRERSQIPAAIARR